MIFHQAPLPGAFIIESEPAADERGWFARTYESSELEGHGLESDFTQASLSYNLRRGTLRGLHWQAEPFAEAKLVSAITGALFDVVVDVRPGSPTFGRWFGARIDADSHRAIYIPRGFAHGFQTLVDDTTVSYHMTAPYHPEAARGVRWDDPSLGIAWPLEAVIVSLRDRSLPRLMEMAA